MTAEVDDNVPIPRDIDRKLARDAKREATLKLASSIFAAGGVGKSTAAKMAVDKIGLWAVIEYQSAIDYLRNNI